MGHIMLSFSSESWGPKEQKKKKEDLGVVEDGCEGVRDVDDATGVAGDNEEEAVCGLENQVLQFVVRQEGGLVRACNTR